jgi:hypothetical protein
MMNRFSMDIARGDVCDPLEDGRLVKMVVRQFFKCRSGGGNVNRRYPDGYLLMFPYSCISKMS